MEKLRYTFQKERLFLDAVESYWDAVSSLAEELKQLDIESSGFQAFREYLTNYKNMPPPTASRRLQERRKR